MTSKTKPRSLKRSFLELLWSALLTRFRLPSVSDRFMTEGFSFVFSLGCKLRITANGFKFEQDQSNLCEF